MIRTVDGLIKHTEDELDQIRREEVHGNLFDDGKGVAGCYTRARAVRIKLQKLIDVRERVARKDAFDVFNILVSGLVWMVLIFWRGLLGRRMRRAISGWFIVLVFFWVSFLFEGMGWKVTCLVGLSVVCVVRGMQEWVTERKVGKDVVERVERMWY